MGKRELDDGERAEEQEDVKRNKVEEGDEQPTGSEAVEADAVAQDVAATADGATGAAAVSKHSSKEAIAALDTERTHLLAELDALKKELAHYESGGTAQALFLMQRNGREPAAQGSAGALPAGGAVTGSGKGTMGFILAEDDEEELDAAAEDSAAGVKTEPTVEPEGATDSGTAVQPEQAAPFRPPPPVFKHPAELVPIPLVPLEKVHPPAARSGITPAHIFVSTPATQIPVLTSDEINTLKIRREQVLRRLQEVRKVRPLPKQHEPHRQEVHHDCVMKEMIWLAKDFSQERRWKMAVASKTSRAAIRAKVSGERKLEQNRRANEHKLRQIARGIAKDIKLFWQKIETVASFKHESKLQEKHQALRQKHLEFLVNQTERYSGLIAEKLETPAPRAIEGASPEGAAAEEDADANIDAEPTPAPRRWQDDLIGGTEEKLEAALEHAERAGEKGVPLEAEDAEFLPTDDGDDDETTLEPEEDVHDAKEIAELESQSQIPMEQLIDQHNRMAEALGEEESSSEDEDDDEEVPAEGADGEQVAPASEAPTTASTAPSSVPTISPAAAEANVADLTTAPAPAVDAAVPEASEAAIKPDPEPAAMEVDATPPEAAASDAPAGSGPTPATTEQAPEASAVKPEQSAEPAPAPPEAVIAPPAAAEQQPAPPEEDEELIAAADQARMAQPTGTTLQTTKVQTPVPFLLKATLREYQHVGVDWLATMFDRRLNGILADEMGLGKTIQTISLLAHLACEKGNWGPHLIVVPTSVMLNWEIEFKKFCPAFKVLTYYGTQKERKMKRQGWSKPNSFHVCITSYKLVMQDHAAFKRKKWVYLILDEAQNIKNFKSQRWQMLLNFNSKRRLLLTGTPLQNNLMELWSLMHFLMPHVFQSHKEFSEWFANPLTAMVEGRDQHAQDNFAVVKRLHGVLRPFILRRLKKDVELQMPPKHEHVIKCPLSKRQRNLYDEFLRRSDVRATLGSGRLLGILNVLMQLRKCCNHPDMFEERPIVSPFDSQRLSLEIPWEVLTAAQPDLWNSATLSLLNLGGLAMDELHLGGHHDTKRTIALQETSETILKQKLEVCENDGMLSSVFAKYNQPLRTRQKELHTELASRITLNNARRVAAKPIYGKDLHYAVTLKPEQGTACAVAARTQGRYAAQCPAALVDGVCTIEQRVAQLEPYILMNLFCIIPKARAKSVQIVSRAQEALFAQDGDSKFLPIKPALDNALAMTRPANIRLQMFFPDKRLLQFDCGKLQQLDILLRRLKAGGHRALIFTQMTKMLDILEGFLNFYGYVYVRLDGTTRVEERQQLMERFNHNDKIFIFILSTRSGGFGINLVGADSVIFYDSDWNPAMDAQAQDRAHRIGQTRPVHIYRLISEHTVEENILKKCNQKRQLDNLVMQDGSFTPEFFKKLNLRELFDSEHVEDVEVKEASEEELNRGMEDAEEATDRDATKALNSEMKEGETEFELKGECDEENAGVQKDAVEKEKKEDSPVVGSPPENLTATEEAGEGVGLALAGKAGVEDEDVLKSVRELTKTEGIALAIEEKLSAVQKYALRFIESVYADVAALQLNQLDERMNAGTEEWGMDEFERIRQEEEEAMDEDDEVLFYEVGNAQTSAELYFQHTERLRLQGVPEPQLDVFGPPDPASADVYEHPADAMEEDIAGFLNIRPPQSTAQLRVKRKSKSKKKSKDADEAEDYRQQFHYKAGLKSDRRLAEMEEAERLATEGKYGRMAGGSGSLRRAALKRKAMDDVCSKKRRRAEGHTVFDEHGSDEELGGGSVVRGFRSGLVSSEHLELSPVVGDVGGLFSYSKAKGVKKPARRVVTKASKPGDSKANKKKDLGWSMEEDQALELAVREFGDNWKLVADMVAMHHRVLPRKRFTDNECKDYYFERDYIREEGGKPPSSQSRTAYATAVLRSVQRCAGKVPPIIDIKGAEAPKLRVEPRKPQSAPSPAPAEGTEAPAPAPPPAPIARFVDALTEQTSSHNPLELIQLKEAQKPKQSPADANSLKHHLKMGGRSSLMRSSMSAPAAAPQAPSEKQAAAPEAVSNNPTPSTPTKGSTAARGGKAVASPRAKPKSAGKRTPRAKTSPAKGATTLKAAVAATTAGAAQAAPAPQAQAAQMTAVPQQGAQQPLQAGTVAAPATMQMTAQQQAAAAAAQQQQAAAAAAQQQAAAAAAQQQAAAAAAQQQAAATAAQQQAAAAAAQQQAAAAAAQQQAAAAAAAQQPQKPPQQ